MKKIMTLKMGYSAGIYGCSAEYFTTIIINGENIGSISYQGLYGAEERIHKALEEKGFDRKYIAHSYGKVAQKDMPGKLYISEYDAIKEIEANENGWLD